MPNIKIIPSVLLLSLLVLPGACTKKKNSDPSGSVSIGAPQGNGEGFTGVIINPTNARVLCGFSQSSNSGDTYNVDCRAAVVQSDGSQVEATAIAGGVNLNWKPPKKIDGADLTNVSCSVSDSQLSLVCQVQLSGFETISRLEVDLQVHDDSGNSSTPSAIVTLPYSVQTFGFNVQSPFLFSVTASSANSLPGFSFTNQPMDPNRFFDYLYSACAIGDRIFFANRQHVFVLQNGKVLLYAGSDNPLNVNEYSYRLRIYFGDGPLAIACGAQSLYVANNSWGSLYQIRDDGPVKALVPSAPWSPSAPLFELQGIAVSSGPNGDTVYLSSYNQDTILKLDASGHLITVAGQAGVPGTTGDGGPATKGTLTAPGALAVGSEGSLYFTDNNGGLIRKVDASGLLATVATLPSGASHFNGIAFSGDGNLLASAVQGTSSVIYKVSSTGSLSPLSLSSGVTLDAPHGVFANSLPALSVLATAPSSAIYFIDISSSQLKQITTQGVVTSLAGYDDTHDPKNDLPQPAVAATLGGAPSGLFFMPDGSLLISDSFQNRIKKIDKNGTLTVIAGAGYSPSDNIPAFNAQLNLPWGLARAADGSLFVAESWGNRIRKIDPQGIITTYAGSVSGNSQTLGDEGPATSAFLSYPTGIALDTDGSLFISDTSDYRIRKVTPDGIIHTIAGTGSPTPSGDGGPALQAGLGPPMSLALVPGVALFFVNSTVQGTVRRIDLKTGTITTIAGSGVWGLFSGDGGPALNAPLSAPTNLTIDPEGRLYLVERNNNRLRMLVPQTDGSYVISSILGGVQQQDCGMGAAQLSALPSNFFANLQATLGVVCLGQLFSVTVQSTCSSPNGTYTLAISQGTWGVEHGGSILVVNRPCNTGQ